MLLDFISQRWTTVATYYCLSTLLILDFYLQSHWLSSPSGSPLRFPPFSVILHSTSDSRGNTNVWLFSQPGTALKSYSILIIIQGVGWDFHGNVSRVSLHLLSAQSFLLFLSTHVDLKNISNGSSTCQSSSQSSFPRDPNRLEQGVFPL